MRPPATVRSAPRRTPHVRTSTLRQQGGVLIIVLWVALGIVSLALYFGHSMSLELRSSENRSAAMAANQAIEGTARYIGYVLTQLESPGEFPDPLTYYRDAIPVGDATVWLIGRDRDLDTPVEPYFALTDEGSKLNLNTATQAMLELLPGMTAEFAAAIVDWRDSDSEVTSGGGAEDETYQRKNPPYRCKNAKFESVDELRLVSGATLEILYGEDTNQNGVLDTNENDGDASNPTDNRDGKLNSGIMEYVTVFSRFPNTKSDGTTRINVTANNAQQQLATLFQQKFSVDRANEILRNVGGGPGGGGGGGGGQSSRSVLEFFFRSGMTAEEFALVEDDLIAGTAAVEGLVNVNTASEAVLTCIPGLGKDKAAELVAYRRSHTDKLNTLGWVKDLIDAQIAAQAGPYLTGRSLQYRADIAATGQNGRGYHREQMVFDISESTPRIVYRKDMTQLGWALGRKARTQPTTTTSTLVRSSP